MFGQSWPQVRGRKNNFPMGITVWQSNVTLTSACFLLAHFGSQPVHIALKCVTWHWNVTFISNKICYYYYCWKMIITTYCPFFHWWYFFYMYSHTFSLFSPNCYSIFIISFFQDSVSFSTFLPFQRAEVFTKKLSDWISCILKRFNPLGKG